MRWMISLLTLFLAVGAESLAWGNDPSRTKILDETVVYIECKTLNSTLPVRKGTGVIVDPEGKVLTARHVVFGTLSSEEDSPDIDEIECTGARSNSSLPKVALLPQVTVTKFDAALLKYPKPTMAGSFPFLKFCDLDDEMLGARIWSYGFSLNHAPGSPSLRVGVLSTTNPDRDGRVQTDSATTEGMSGGMVTLADTNGKLIGIIAGSETDNNGLATHYAMLPAEEIQKDPHFGLIQDNECEVVTTEELLAKLKMEFDQELRKANLRADLAMAMIRYQSKLEKNDLDEVKKVSQTNNIAKFRTEIINRMESPAKKTDAVIAYFQHKFDLEILTEELSLLDEFENEMTHHNVLSRIEESSHRLRKLRDTIERLLANLTEVEWRLTFQEDRDGSSYFDLNYKREIPAEPFSAGAYMCFIAIVEVENLPFTGAKNLKDILNPNEAGYFRFIDTAIKDGKFKIQNFCNWSKHASSSNPGAELLSGLDVTNTTAAPVDRPIASVNKFGGYSFTLNEPQKKWAWPENFKEKILYVPIIKYEAGEGAETNRTIVRRYLIKMDRDNRVFGCHAFEKLDDIAVFLNKKERNQIERKSC